MIAAKAEGKVLNGLVMLFLRLSQSRKESICCRRREGRVIAAVERRKPLNTPVAETFDEEEAVLCLSSTCGLEADP